MDKNESGIIIEALPSLRFRTQLSDGRIIIAYLSGKMHKNFIRVIIGDKVEVTIPSTGNIGRIIRRNG